MALKDKLVTLEGLKNVLETGGLKGLPEEVEQLKQGGTGSGMTAEQAEQISQNTEQISQNTEDIAGLKTQVSSLSEEIGGSTPVVIPDYVQSNINKIESNLATFENPGCFNFALITDIHADTYTLSNTKTQEAMKRSVMAINDLATRHDIKMIVLGGDYLKNDASSTKENCISVFKSLDAVFRESEIPVCVLWGNHDSNTFGMTKEKFISASERAITSSGQNYIDTGVAPTAWKLKYRVNQDMFDLSDGQTSISAEFGALDTTNGLERSHVSTAVITGGPYTVVNAGSKYYSTRVPDKIFVAERKNDGTTTLYNGDETEALKSESLSVQPAPNNFYLFARNRKNSGGDVIEYMPGGTSNIYYFKAWDSSDNLIADMIPVLDTSGTPCFYCRVRQQYYYNQGTGTLTAIGGAPHGGSSAEPTQPAGLTEDDVRQMIAEAGRYIVEPSVLASGTLENGTAGGSIISTGLKLSSFDEYRRFAICVKGYSNTNFTNLYVRYKGKDGAMNLIRKGTASFIMLYDWLDSEKHYLQATQGYSGSPSLFPFTEKSGIVNGNSFFNSVGGMANVNPAIIDVTQFKDLTIEFYISNELKENYDWWFVGLLK